MSELMKGKRGLVMGVANDHSIAWGIARTLAAHGAELAFTYQGDALAKRVKPLADSVKSSLVLPCDVEDVASVDAVFDEIKAKWGTMDFLIASLALWARERGYVRFSLGMAPLSGIADRRLAPAWARLAAFAFRHGERLYGFRGLRAYKEKFAPRWEPRYVAGPGGLGLILALRDVTRLIGDRSPPPTATRRAPIVKKSSALLVDGLRPCAAS